MAHRVSTGTPSEIEASFYMEQGTALAARNEFGMRLDSDLADPLMFRIGPFLVTGLLYVVGVQGNSGLRSLVMKPSISQSKFYF